MLLNATTYLNYILGMLLNATTYLNYILGALLNATTYLRCFSYAGLHSFSSLIYRTTVLFLNLKYDIETND